MSQGDMPTQGPCSSPKCRTPEFPAHKTKSPFLCLPRPFPWACSWCVHPRLRCGQGQILPALRMNHGQMAWVSHMHFPQLGLGEGLGIPLLTLPHSSMRLQEAKSSKCNLAFQAVRKVYLLI